jgi:signal transduction histidine kinase
MDFVGGRRWSGTRTDLNAVVQKALLPAKGRMRDPGIRLDLQLDKDLPPVNADQTQMEQVFFNLISNALNAVTGVYRLPVDMQENASGTDVKKPFLRIMTGRRDNNIYVSFQDNGPGISPEDIPRIFEPFFSTQEKVSRVGIGLWMCRMMITAHGGRISVESEIGRGSLFTVELPISGGIED